MLDSDVGSERAIEEIRFDTGESSRIDTKPGRETLKENRRMCDQWYQKQQTNQGE
jgi:hypothetical protein